MQRDPSNSEAAERAQTIPMIQEAVETAQHFADNDEHENVIEVLEKPIEVCHHFELICFHL